MDNQSDGNARNIGTPGSGSSMGKDLGNETGGNPGAAISKGAASLHHSIDKAADAAPAVVDRLTTGAHAGVDKVEGALAVAGETAGQKARQLSEAYKNFAESGRDYVRGRPATSILVALAAGYTLSKLLGRRN